MLHNNGSQNIPANKLQFMQMNMKSGTLVFTLCLILMNYTAFFAKAWLPHNLIFVCKVF